MGVGTVSNTFTKLYSRNFTKRIISAGILIPIVLFLIYLGGNIYNLLVSAIGCGMLIEIYNMTKRKKNTTKQMLAWLFFSILYTVAPCFSFIYLRQLDPHGLTLISWLMFTVWATDTGAYFVGCTLQGPKILPRISPKKTWSGLLGGILSAIAIGYVFDVIYPAYKYSFSYMSALVAIIAQCGDFLESAIKRHFDVKDSSNLIPGHGGILDRVDGLLTASLFVMLLEFYY